MQGKNIEQPVVQLVNYQRVMSRYTTQDGYYMTITDGTFSCAFAILSMKLNDLITNGELQRKSIIRIDRYTCVDTRNVRIKKSIRIWNLTVLVKGNFVEDVADSSNFIIPYPIPDSETFYERSNRVNLAAKLTAGCIKAIFRGESIKQPVVQLLFYETSKSLKGSYLLEISDGTRSCNLIVFKPHLNYLKMGEQLQEHNIIRLDQYRLVEPSMGKIKKLMVIYQLSILEKGEDVKKIGIAEQIPSTSTEVSISIPDPVTSHEKDNSVNLAAKLTAGCIKAIFRGENIAQPVVQLLDYRKTERGCYFHLKISDGTRSCSLVVLKPQLNYLITSGQLQEHDIIRLDQYRLEYRSVEPRMGKIKKVMVIYQLSILEKGEDGKKIGIAEQIPSTSTKASIFIPYSHDTSYSVNLAAKLTPGCIKEIFRGENIAQPVVQLVDYLKTPAFYRLLISDGTFISAWVGLESNLNYLIVSGKLQKRDIIRLDEYRCFVVLIPPGKIRIMILIIQLSILEKGEDVKEIGITKQIPSTLTDVSIYIPDSVTSHEKCNSINLAAKLTPGCIEAIFRGENIEQPVVQLLDYHKIEKRRYISLKISDGTFFCSWIGLIPQLNNLIISGQLQKRDIIRLDQYRCVESSISTTKIKKLMVISQLSILEKGEVVKEIGIAEQIPSTSTKVSIYNRIPTCIDLLWIAFLLFLFYCFSCVIDERSYF